jgi:hypothetical protein
MKRAFLVAAAATILIAAPSLVLAQASTNVAVTGSVGKQCGVGNQSGGGLRPTGAAQVDLGNLVTSDGQLATSTPTAIAFDNVWCNAPSTLSMDVTPLKLQNAPAFDASSFTAALDLNVNSDGTHKILSTYFGIPTLSSTNGSTDGVKTVQIAAFETGTLTFSEALLTYSMPVNAHSPGIRPLAGTYTGTVTVTATPN